MLEYSVCASNFFYFREPKSKRQILFHGFLALEKVPASRWLWLRGQTPKQRFGEDSVGTEGGGWNFDALPNGRMAKQQHAYYLFIIISKSFSGAHRVARALSCRALNYQSDGEGPVAASA
jgi:hypothetical protein